MLIARLNGCGETSTRQRSSRTPSRRRTPRTAASCASTGTATSGAAGRAAASATSGGSASRQRAEDLLHARGRQPVVVVGQQRVVGMAAVVEARRVLARELDVALERGREEGEVRPCARASCHTAWPSAAACTRAAASSAGTRRSRSQSRRARRTTSRSTSPSSPSAVDLLQPRADVVARSRARASRRCSAPSCCARAAAPAGGIIVRWSQAARRPSEERSASSASRSRRDSSADIRDRLRAAPDPRSSGHGRRLPRLRPRGLRVVRRARARQLEGLLHRDPRALRDRGPRRPAGDARGAQPDLRRRGQGLSPAAQPALRACRDRRPTRRGPTACCTACTGRRPRLYAQLSARGPLRRARATTSWRATSSSASAPPSSTTAPARSSPTLVAAARAGGLEVVGESLRTAPRGYPRDHPRGELLRHKALVAGRSLPGTAGIGRDEALEHVGSAHGARPSRSTPGSTSTSGQPRYELVLQASRFLACSPAQRPMRSQSWVRVEAKLWQWAELRRT